jgi:hypothetical protein
MQFILTIIQKPKCTSWKKEILLFWKSVPTLATGLYYVAVKFQLQLRLLTITEQLNQGW